jgi:anti-sigma B factor antagonist
MAPTGKPDPYKIQGDASGQGQAPSTRSDPIDPKFDVLDRRGILVITLLKSNVLDSHEIESLGTELQNFLSKKPAAKVVLDLHGVQHLSSAALGMLLSLKSRIESTGGALRLANVRDELQEIFKLTKLHKVLTIKESVDAAAASL